jgi:hypothetical protein
MRQYTLIELFRLTRDELFSLQARIAAQLPHLGDAEYALALQTLRQLRQMLSRPRNAP